jgi:hypothetical protein
MIYCITSLDSNGNTLYKIGYTDNMKTRINHYLTHNPSCNLVKTMDGSRLDEKCIHKYLHLKGLCKYRQEWYSDSESVKKVLSQPLDETNQFLWENRDVVFSKCKLRNVEWFNLYKRLERKNRGKKSRYVIKSSSL